MINPTPAQKSKLCQACAHRRNYFCKKHGDEIRRLVEGRATCEGWGNARPPRQRPPVQNLAIVSCHFNPCGFKAPVENCRRFLDAIGQPVTLVELSFNGRFQLDSQVRIEGDPARNLMWQKERLLNIGIQSLPDDVDAVAWIDADLIFKNPDWYEQTKRQLATRDFVQLFERVEYLGGGGGVERSFPGWAAGGKGQKMPGGAWAARRDAIGGGLPDSCIVGGGDWELAITLETGRAVGFTPGVVQHLYHGSFDDRQHNTREKILKRHHFNKKRDIATDPKNGLWMWSTFKPELHADVKAYFQNRKEDEKPAAAASLDPAPAGKTIPKVFSPVEPKKHRESFSCDVILPYSQPNYRYLEDSIKSVLNQNFVETTIHLVNDGVDHDPIGREYSRLDNVRLYENTDRPAGPYVTYNRLFRFLETDLVANQDSDDLSLPMRLYKSIQLIQQGFDIVGGSMEQFVTYDDPDERMRRALTWKPYHYSGKVYAASPSGTVVNSTMVMKKSVYESCNGMAPWIAGADSEFYERCIQAGFKAAALQDVVALRRLHNPSLSNDQVTSGHGSNLREEIKRWTAESIERQKRGPDHSIGGLTKHRNDNQLVQIKGPKSGRL